MERRTSHDAGMLTFRCFCQKRKKVDHFVQLYQQIVYDDVIQNKQKSKIVMVFSEVDKRLVDGADEHLSILDLALRISDMLAGTR